MTIEARSGRALHKVIHASEVIRTICTKRECSEACRNIVLVRAQSMSMDRRDFLRLLTSAAALAATGIAVTEADDSPAPLPERRVDVVIVGAGLAGLTGARP